MAMIETTSWVATYGEGRLTPWRVGNPGNVESALSQMRTNGSHRVLSLVPEPEIRSPMLSQRAGIRVIFEGVLHDREELVSRFTVQLPSQPSDADLAACAYRQWGDDSLLRLRGVFVLIVWDLAQDRFLCGRDRVGLHPLFYADVGQTLLLSTSIESLLEHPAVSRELNRLALIDHLSRRWLRADETYFAQVKRVPPCHALRIDRLGRLIYKYWDPQPPKMASDWIPDDEAQVQFNAVFRHAVARSLPFGTGGTTLSGGIDSSAVAMVAAELCETLRLSKPLALSLMFPGPEVDDAAEQRTTAAMFRLEHKQYAFADATGLQGAVAATLALGHSMPTPATNVLAPAFNYLVREASHFGCKTLFTGDGADEWVGVNPHLARDQLLSLNLKGMYQLWRTFSRTFPEGIETPLNSIFWRWSARPILRDAWLTPSIQKVARAAAPEALASFQRRRVARTRPDWLLPDESLREQLEQRETDWWDRTHSDLVTRNFCLQFSRSMLDVPEKIMFHEENFVLARRSGVRIAQPFWDADLIELMMKIRPQVRMRGGFTKALLLDPLMRRFPDSGFEKRKKSYTGNVILAELVAGARKAKIAMGGIRALSELGLVDPLRANPFLDHAFAGTDDRAKTSAWEILCLESWAQARCKV